MTRRTARSMMAMSLVAMAMSFAGTHVSGQSRGSAGPHLKALPAKLYTPSRTPDGQPDLQGEWNPLMRMGSPSHSLEEGGDPADSIPQGQGVAHLQASHQGVVIDPPDGRIPYRPAVAAIRRQLLIGVETPTRRSDLDTNDRCLSLGVPRFAVFPFQIAQRPGHVVMLSGWGHLYRSIPLDNRPHLSQNLKLWMGNSRGHWEGNTLVVDVTNNNDKFWIDSHATIHSDEMHVVERFTLVDANTLFYQATVDDPKVYTRPWTMALTLDRSKDPKPEIWEEACWEGERSVPNMLAVGRKAKSEGKTGIHEHRYEYWLNEALKMEAATKAATPDK